MKVESIQKFVQEMVSVKMQWSTTIKEVDKRHSRQIDTLKKYAKDAVHLKIELILMINDWINQPIAME